ncbi:PRKCI [Cordylochernes scorpioides]|uniref:PRKCI n=1 Tax=Cordylochernes scorpioides TaxID=51811 RepID=A0ABY6LQ25_9ARAC|nr:PRKCI [Cordylochernes scorpioides]
MHQYYHNYRFRKMTDFCTTELFEILRSHRRGMEYTIMTGKTSGRRIPGRPPTCFVYQLKELTGLTVAEMVHRTQDRDGWRHIVFGMLCISSVQGRLQFQNILLFLLIPSTRGTSPDKHGLGTGKGGVSRSFEESNQKEPYSHVKQDLIYKLLSSLKVEGENGDPPDYLEEDLSSWDSLIDYIGWPILTQNFNVSFTALSSVDILPHSLLRIYPGVKFATNSPRIQCLRGQKTIPGDEDPDKTITTKIITSGDVVSELPESTLEDSPVIQKSEERRQQKMIQTGCVAEEGELIASDNGCGTSVLYKIKRTEGECPQGDIQSENSTPGILSEILHENSNDLGELQCDSVADFSDSVRLSGTTAAIQLDGTELDAPWKCDKARWSKHPEVGAGNPTERDRALDALWKSDDNVCDAEVARNVSAPSSAMQAEKMCQECAPFIFVPSPDKVQIKQPPPRKSSPDLETATGSDTSRRFKKFTALCVVGTKKPRFEGFGKREPLEKENVKPKEEKGGHDMDSVDRVDESTVKIGDLQPRRGRKRRKRNTNDHNPLYIVATECSQGEFKISDGSIVGSEIWQPSCGEPPPCARQRDQSMALALVESGKKARVEMWFCKQGLVLTLPLRFREGDDPHVARDVREIKGPPISASGEISLFGTKRIEKGAVKRCSREIEEKTWGSQERRLSAPDIPHGSDTAAPSKEACLIPVIQSLPFTIPTCTNDVLKIDDFERIVTIGRGGFGSVFLAQHKDSRDFYALKAMKKRPDFKTEREVLQIAKGFPFLMGLVTSFETPDEDILVMDLVEGFNFLHYMNQWKKISEEKARFYTTETALALHYLHTHNIIHRDVKLENILLNSDGHIKLVDYGLCKLNMRPGQKTNRFCGTLTYMAPEIIQKKPYDFGVDWWALGATLYEMLVNSNYPAVCDVATIVLRVSKTAFIRIHSLYAESQPELQRIIIESRQDYHNEGDHNEEDDMPPSPNRSHKLLQALQDAFHVIRTTTKDQVS